MKPRAILVRVRRAVEEHDFTFVPSLVRLPNICKIERGESIGRVRGNSTHATLVPLAAMGRVTVVPDVDWDLQALKSHPIPPHRGYFVSKSTARGYLEVSRI